MPSMVKVDRSTTELEQLLDETGLFRGRIKVVARVENRLLTTSPSEILTCQIDQDGSARFFCKYRPGVEHGSHGHRRGLNYEANVYSLLLEELDITTPRYICSGELPTTRMHCLLIEYLGGSTRLVKGNNPRLALQWAAAWLGHFHRMSSPCINRPALSFMTRHERTYYLGWADRTRLWAKEQGLYSAWLAKLCDEFDDIADFLSQTQDTIIHGEFYPDNVLLLGHDVYPIDWESAAIGPGEVDLVTLAEGWTDSDILALEEQYANARWPNGTPYDLHRSFCFARIFVQFRWLGDLGYPEKWKAKYLSALRVFAKDMGLI